MFISYLGIAVHVYQDVNAISIDHFSNLDKVSLGRDVDEAVAFTRDLGSEGCLVVRRECVAENLDFRPIVHSRNALHEVRGRMISEVGTDVTYSKATAGAG